MILIMSRPWEHPDTGVCYFRKAVPDDLKAVIGKWEEKRSLRTKDGAEAKRLHALAAVDVDREWADARRSFGTASYRIGCRNH